MCEVMPNSLMLNRGEVLGGLKGCFSELFSFICGGKRPFEQELALLVWQAQCYFSPPPVIGCNVKRRASSLLGCVRVNRDLIG